MALVVNTNVASLVAQKNLGASQSKLDTAMERLSSGSRINSASDDAAGLAIASRMESQVRGLNQAVRNANDGISLAQTAEGAMEEITSMLQRMRELSVQGANGVNKASDLEAIDAEITALKAEIDRVAMNTTFNGKSLLDGSFGISLQLGAEAGETIAVSVKNMSTSSLGGADGATSATAVTSASFSGAEATKTVSKMTFNGNDTYNFVLTLGGLGDTDDTYAYNISADVSAGSAKDIVDKINAALRKAPVAMYDDSATAFVAASDPVASAADSIRATFVGNTVTIENLTGSTVKVDAGSATFAAGPPTSQTIAGQISNTGSTVSYTSVTSGDVKTLASGNYNATSLINQGPATVSTSGGTAAVKSTFEFGFFAAGTAGDTAADYALDAGDRIVLDLTVGSQTITLDTGAMNATTNVAGVVAQLNAALTTSGNTEYTIAVTDGTNAPSTGNIVITRADGQDFTVATGTGHSLATTTTQTISKIANELSAGATTARSHDVSGTATLGLAFNDTQLAVKAAPGGGVGIQRGQKFDFTLTDVASGASVTVNTGNISGAAADLTVAEVAAAMETALTNAGASGYTFANDTTAQTVTITRTDGKEFTFKMENLVQGTASAAGTGVTVNEAPAALVVGTTAASTGLVANDGTVAVPGTTTTPESKSIMYLDILAEDTFSLKGAGIDSAGAITAATSGVSFEYTGTASSLELAASRIKAELNAITQSGKTFNFNTEVVDGRIKITENNGNKFAITGFTSAGSGRIAASVPSEQAASASASAVLLDDATYASSASTSAAGAVKVTDVDMHFGAAADKYSFTISDGTATATVALTKVLGASANASEDGNGSDILAAINVALDQAGMSDTVTAAVTAEPVVGTPPALDTGAVITLKHKLGYELKIADFTSVGNQTVKVVAGSGDTTGVAKFLDDNGGGATGATISTISAGTSSLAADAIDVIDNALKSVSAERASLGAVQNRLDYTINNLTNISVNTAAAQSRIQDADYAVEAANLAKAQIMQQAGTAMLAQANAMQQTVLSLLQ